MSRHLPFDQRFDSYVVKNPNGCWHWIGPKHSEGYGEIYRGKTLLLAHRVSYEKYIGPIPHGLSVLHRCDNPPCTRPDHLFAGTQADNVRDMVGKKRNRGNSNRGTKRYNAKLTESVVAEIRELVRQNKTNRATPMMKLYASLADIHGVAVGTIRDVTSRRWSHVK